MYGNDNIIKKSLETFSNTKEELVGCIDHTEVAMHVTIEPIWNAFIRLRQKGVKIKLITEVTPENIFYCKKLMEIVRLRHIDGIKSNFGVADRGECLHTISNDAQSLSHAIKSNAKGLVEAQQFLFETLWSKSIPADQRIREIETGIFQDTIDVIHDHSKVRALYSDLVKNAQSEIMLILPTANALIRQEKINAIPYMLQAARERNVRVRILMPLLLDAKELTIIKEKFGGILDKKAEKMKHAEENIFNDGHDEKINTKLIDFRYIEPMLETSSTILLVDGKFSLVMELKDDAKESFDEAIGLSIYSNSKPSVFSYVSIFENLWLQTDLYNQIKKANEKLETHDKILNEFVRIAAHELRNPLQPILGLSQILKSKITQTKEWHLTTDEASSILDAIIRFC